MEPLTQPKAFEMLNVDPESSRINLVGAIQELVKGIADSYFDKSFFEKISTTLKTKPSGEYVDYWPNGQIKVKATYKNLYPDGHLHGWYENGLDAFKGFYKDGIRIGIHFVSYPPEKRDFNDFERILNYNDNGKLDGDQTLINDYPERRLKAIFHFKDNKLDGKSLIYLRKGVMNEWQFKDGKLVSEK